MQLTPTYWQQQQQQQESHLRHVGGPAQKSFTSRHTNPIHSTPLTGSLWASAFKYATQVGAAKCTQRQPVAKINKRNKRRQFMISEIVVIDKQPYESAYCVTFYQIGNTWRYIYQSAFRPSAKRLWLIDPKTIRATFLAPFDSCTMTDKRRKGAIAIGHQTALAATRLIGSE